MELWPCFITQSGHRMRAYFNKSCTMYFRTLNHKQSRAQIFNNDWLNASLTGILVVWIHLCHFCMGKRNNRLLSLVIIIDKHYIILYSPQKSLIKCIKCKSLMSRCKSRFYSLLLSCKKYIYLYINIFLCYWFPSRQCYYYHGYLWNLLCLWLTYTWHAAIHEKGIAL